MDEDDIYGAELYGGMAASGGQDEAYEQRQGDAGGGDLEDNPSNSHLQELTETMAHQKQHIEELEAQLQTTASDRERWRAKAEASTSGRTNSDAAKQNARSGRSNEQRLQTELAAARQKEANLQAQVAEGVLEAVELRRQLHAARAAADPNIIQVRQLLLDPAVHREFQRLHHDAESKAQEIKQLKDELKAVSFSQESKAGRLLMAKCRALQDENEEMGRELSEGKVHALERQVALAKGYVDDMRKGYNELEDHCAALDEEAEDLQRQVFNLKREVKEMESRDAGWSRDKGGYMGNKPGGGPKYAGYNKRSLNHVESGPGSADRYNRKRPR
ncbi:hypothetical protein WJX74_005427 [Apatococcus lobatus]|uniref:Uncharacterized protein n=1 Tax=Apatococcus lobatus TaxID=904363 RepID=A0AAW1QK98_9CHLO